MKIFSYHLVNTTPYTTMKAFCRPLTNNKITGLRHVEFMAAMTLGAPILSPARMQLHKLAVFAYWESESDLDAFLKNTELGQVLSKGWYVRLDFLRLWGHFSKIDDLPTSVEDTDPSKPVVAVTLARLKLPQIFRFVQWGKPVEELVRDHPGKTLALAAMRPFHTFSTFSIWQSQEAMTNMVHGKDSFPGATSHAKAMDERNRKDFHHQFITLRFRAISEHGEWLGRNNYVPKQGKCLTT